MHEQIRGPAYIREKQCDLDALYELLGSCPNWSVNATQYMGLPILSISICSYRRSTLPYCKVEECEER